jgi:hypothetical protein
MWQKLWKKKPLLGFSLVSCCAVTIATVIALALIPLYLKTKNMTVYQPNAGTDNLCCLYMKAFSFIYSPISDDLHNNPRWYKCIDGFQYG